MSKLCPVDPVEDKCMLCPLGIVRTHDLGGGHLHDFCDGCEYRMCLPGPGNEPCLNARQ